VVVAVDVVLVGFVGYVILQTRFPFGQTQTVYVPFEVFIKTENVTTAPDAILTMWITADNGVYAGQELSLNIILNVTGDASFPVNADILSANHYGIGFQGGLNWPIQKNTGIQPVNTQVYVAHGDGQRVTSGCCAKFYFPQAGTYYPFLTLYLNNSLGNPQIIFNQNPLSVESQSVENDVIFGQTNEYLAIAVLVFSVIESLVRLPTLYRRSDNLALFRGQSSQSAGVE
jgi:hypothetical protein